ncbi:MAG: hypothetical protein ACQEQN_01610 [Thermodesulfobacteriota bacterium]
MHTNPSSAEKNSRAVSFPVYLFKASAWCAAAFAFSGFFASHQPWLVPLVVMVLSAPLAIGGVYRSTVRKIRFLEIFTRRGRMAKIFSGRILPLLLWSFYAVTTSLFMLIGFRFFSLTDWVLFLSVIPVFYMAYRVFFHLLTKEIKPYLVTSMALSGAVLCTPFIMLAVYSLAVHAFDLPFPRYETLASAIAAHEDAIRHLNGSAFVKGVSEWMAVYGGIMAYAAGHAGYSDIPLASLAALFLAGYVIFFNAVNILTFCLVPAKELKRILLPLSPDPVLPDPRIPARKCIFYAAFLSLFLLTLVAVFFFLEARFSEKSKFAAYHAAARQTVRHYAERIDDAYVRPGTITQIQAYRMDLLRTLGSSSRELEAAIDRAFDDMILRVDDFLDWYYSLFAEYARIAYMLSGSADEHLAAMLERHLNADANFKTVRDQLNILRKRHDASEARLQEAVRRLVEENRIHETGGDIAVARTWTTSEILDFNDFIGFDSRMLSASATSGVGFLTGSVIGKKIVKNVAKKSMFKASARALARFGSARAMGKGGGGGAGAATGAAVGSVVPGGGTAIGATVGGIAGSIAGGLLMDKTLLMAEERYSRKAFQSEMINAIEKTRMETKARLYGR